MVTLEITVLHPLSLSDHEYPFPLLNRRRYGPCYSHHLFHLYYGTKFNMPPPAAFVPREPDGIGVHKPVHPFAATVEAQVPVSLSPFVPQRSDKVECNRTRRIWYQVSRLSHYYRRCLVSLFRAQRTLLIGSLPTGTQLPGGAVLPMSSVADFPMVLPEGETALLL